MGPGAPSVALAVDSGTFGDNITNNATLMVVAEPNSQVQYSENGTSGWSASAPAPAQGSNTVNVRAVDDAGNTSTQTIFMFTYDSIAPAAPIVSLVNDSGIPTDHVTNNGRLNVSGVENGANVLYSTNGGATWTGTFLAAEGINNVLVRQVDVAGNISLTQSFSFTLDTIVESVGVSLAQDTGRSATDKLTRIGDLVLANVEPGALVEYSTNGTNWVSTFTAVEGLNSVYVRQTDVAGNVSTPTLFTFTLDTTSPSAPSVSLASDTGAVVNDKITNNPILSIVAETNALVESSANGTTGWSTTAPTAAEGSNTVYARQTDLAGNVSIATAFTYTLDAMAPTTASITGFTAGTYNGANVPTTFGGNVGDDPAGVGLFANSTTFTLQRASDSKYWSGVSGQTGRSPFPPRMSRRPGAPRRPGRAPRRCRTGPTTCTPSSRPQPIAPAIGSSAPA
jgi:large repetitive protein